MSSQRWHLRSERQKTTEWYRAFRKGDLNWTSRAHQYKTRKLSIGVTIGTEKTQNRQNFESQNVLGTNKGSNVLRTEEVEGKTKLTHKSSSADLPKPL